MSDISKPTVEPNALQKPVPSWIGAGIIGLVVGVGSTLIVLRTYAPSSPATSGDEVASVPGAGPGNAGPAAGGPMPGMGAGMMGAGPMGMPGMGGMMGGGVRGKRNLTSLIGKLDLLTRETLHLELTPEQSAKIADHLVAVEKPDMMTEEEAQKEFETLEALLSPEQKAITDSISLPFSRPTGGMTGSPGGPNPENPLRQETNKQRLQSLLARIQPGSFKTPSNDSPSSNKSADESTKDAPDKSTEDKQPASSESEKKGT